VVLELVEGVVDDVVETVELLLVVVINELVCVVELVATLVEGLVNTTAAATIAITMIITTATATFRLIAALLFFLDLCNLKLGQKERAHTYLSLVRVEAVKIIEQTRFERKQIRGGCSCLKIKPQPTQTLVAATQT
jgi:hypothetical protein